MNIPQFNHELVECVASDKFEDSHKRRKEQLIKRLSDWVTARWLSTKPAVHYEAMTAVFMTAEIIEEYTGRAGMEDSAPLNTLATITGRI